MNNKRLKAIADITEKLGVLLNELETLQSDEQDSYDNMPEHFQESEMGERSSAASAALEEAVGSLEDAIGNLESTIGVLEQIE
ncbi:MAG: hypothetical protein FWE62_02280 [Firmicutes bacterium]|nr:hypothetical protein [Bacillota bacterium]